MLSRNTILENRYRIVRPLGKGGMGQVYEAIDDTIDSIVAIKETLATSDKLRSAFRHEARTLANLKHPTLPRVTHHFFHGDGQFLVMEFIEGLNLAQRLELRGRPFDYAQVMSWADQLLGALTYLHDQKPEPIVHRDIKPANIKVTSEGEIYLLDFGLARGAPGQEASSVHAYTAPYAPLEQLNNSGTTPQSDVYSLGATLYHLLTGQVPITASQRAEALEETGRDPLSLAHNLNPQVPEWLSGIVSRSMSIRKRDRFASASEMRTALRTGLEQAREAETTPLPSPPAPQPKPTEASDEKPKPEEPPQPIHIPTMHAPFVPQPVPEQGATNPVPAAETIAPYDSSPPPKSNRAIIAFAIIAVIVVISGVGFYLLATRESGNQTNTATSNPASITEKPQPMSPPAPSGMVYVPGGEFIMGRDDGDEYERPAHKVTVKPFFIDETEVTCGSYMQFLRATGRAAPASWTLGHCIEDLAPATGITWDDANAFAKWVSKRLPTEEEWEFAARGTDERRYPWGNEWKTGLANANGVRGIANVRAFVGKSPYGAYDMVGNVWEWTASKLTTYPGGQLPINPTSDLRVIRGGAYDSDRNTATTTYRRGYPARGNYDYSKLGFRCAKDLNQSK